ncbi:hypothetical protein GPECTOR_72g595 [Gonium pectorale]|uniref:Reverse transcriptase domain-containing protein n=1 Tax=Gonium pectorale TaxID=33097 RepID=A0A150G2T2_GONPE|nr:hypothetical protein GPECTOR_72g595 [Gonium pectorale]|eukprot:KXZ44148.1 hypothetical protein GPECTOR_72g595 [Gonium pectorale]
MVYLDEILIYSPDITSHVRHLQQVFDLLRLASLKAAVKKCTFGQRRIQFLGHVLDGSNRTVAPSPRNVAVITAYPSPRNVRQVRALLGTVGYYRSFVPGFNLIARSLCDLLKKDAPWRWGSDEEHAFHTQKHALTSDPILRAPEFDHHFFVQTDFCKSAVAACLAQKGDDGKEFAVKFTTKKLTPAQMAWSSADGEAHAAVWAIKTHIRNCESCKADRHKLREIPHCPHVDTGAHRLHGPYKKTARGNRYCILAVDSWSKYPQTNGQAERLVGALLDSLRKLITNHREGDWDLQIHQATYAYWADKQISTGLSPAMFVFGRELTTAFERERPPIDEDEEEEDVMDMAEEEIERRRSTTTPWANAKKPWSAWRRWRRPIW